jgi:epoxyqueuosine reductase QueG
MARSIQRKKTSGFGETDAATLTEDLRNYLQEEGADLTGFGGVNRLEGAPEIMRPQRYLPDASSVIAIGVHVNEAVCNLIARHARRGTDPPSYHSYQLFTLVMINRELDRLAYLGAKYLEDLGYHAYPFPANVPHITKPSKEYPGGPGDVSHKHIAVACGLGQIGWHTMLITPQFKTRQKLVSITTNAPLVSDPMCEDTLCNPESCGRLCASVCPTNAIPTDAEKSERCIVGGREVVYCRLEGWRCRWGCSGMLKCTGGYRDIPIPDEEPNEEELLEYKARVDPWQTRLKNTVGLVPYCGRCYTVCPGSGLHRKGRQGKHTHSQ